LESENQSNFHKSDFHLEIYHLPEAHEVLGGGLALPGAELAVVYEPGELVEAT
jgi:hypothetical protein